MKLRPLSVDAAISDRLMGATLRRAIIRAFMADELTLEEIAGEFSCSRSYVKQVTATMGEARSRVRRRRRNARVEQERQGEGAEDGESDHAGDAGGQQKRAI